MSFYQIKGVLNFLIPTQKCSNAALSASTSQNYNNENKNL